MNDKCPMCGKSEVLCTGYTVEQIADAAMAAEIPDSKLESLLIALAEQPKGNQ